MEGDNDNFYCDLGVCSGGAGGTSFAEQTVVPNLR
jgi:hypothetical protein